MVDVVMEEEKRMMNANPPIHHVARRSWRDSRSGFIYINLSLCQHTFLKHPHVIISGGWHHLCLLMAMSASMVNPTWRHGEIFGMCLLWATSRTGEVLCEICLFFFLQKAVINTEKQSHEMSHCLQSRTNFFLNLPSS